jgi:multimeric flavodoxin WrbA
MGKNVVAIVGSYRKDGTVESAVDAILDAAAEKGARTGKIHLLDKHIEFCTNCRFCTQSEGPRRGRCVLQDDLESVLSELDAADAIVLGAPVNFYNVTALFRRFMERLVGAAYWPWGKGTGPVLRKPTTWKKAVLVTSAAMPGFLIPLTTGAPRALKVTAQVLHAQPVATLRIGLSAVHARQELPDKIKQRASRIGRSLA